MEEIARAPANGPLPLDLVVAAESILLDMENFGLRQAINEVADMMDFADDVSLSFDDLLGIAPQLKALKFATWCSNLGIDAGSFVKEAAYTEGFASLATYYKGELERTAEAFTADGGDTEENAWKFYKNYVMLWKMREYGEKKFAEMYNIKGAFGELLMWFNGINIKDVNAVVDTTLSLLKENEFKFNAFIEIPQQYEYLQKIVMHCPVALEILDKQGNLIFTIPDGVEIDVTNSYELLYFWAYGSRYMVEKSLSKEYRGSFRAGGIGTRHKVEARLVNAEDDEDPDPTKIVRRSAGLYLELNKWFVNAANPA